MRTRTGDASSGSVPFFLGFALLLWSFQDADGFIKGDLRRWLIYGDEASSMIAFGGSRVCFGSVIFLILGALLLSRVFIAR
ncbi:hypothetical protein EUTSA_v10002892mg [Eutrema salsugineum]|uniref:CASP-like protein n=1 Tax=Eutrema salsugineum TaxID=72664 RepID=V4MYE2_EUTSA|nr:hypothetical protein EUTSA_v10002892mg [Eutrema salsugineum]